MRRIGLCVGMAFAGVGPAAAQEPSLTTVLQRAGTYVALVETAAELPLYEALGSNFQNV